MSEMLKVNKSLTQLDLGSEKEKREKKRKKSELQGMGLERKERR